MFYILYLTSVLGWDQLVGNPNQKTRDLFNYIASQYGSYTLSGQFNYYDELVSIVKKKPLIRGFDMQNYSPHNPWHDDWSSWDDGTVQAAINWYKQTQGIVTFQWHWFSPMGGSLRTSTFYTDFTDFSTSKAVLQGTDEYKATLKDIDAIAVQLKRLQTEGISILWRPLHEAGGKWFWWGADGSLVTKQLYDIMFDRLVNYHKLDNLIWVWSTPEPDWYPGKDKVDIIGFDSYPGSYNKDCNLNMYMQLHDIVSGSKLVALSELGPLPDIDQCFSIGAHWIYFMGWSDLVVQQNDREHLIAQFNNKHVKTLI